MIYLVDDDAEELEILEETLRQYGYEGQISTARDGEEVMRVLRSDPVHKPDLLLLDLNMPLKDGFEVLAEIKSDAALRDIVVVVLTASSNKTDEERCRSLGCDYFFTKPSRMEEYQTLISFIRELV